VLKYIYKNIRIIYKLRIDDAPLQSLNLFNKIQTQLSNSIHTKIHTRSNSTYNIHESLLVLLQYIRQNS
jgi:hypothetical protein